MSAATERTAPERQTVAIVGASADRTKFGNISVRAHAQAGYHVYPINPRGGVIEGWSVCASLEAVPEPRLSRISVYLPPARTLELIEMLARVPHDELWLNPGTADDAVRAALAQRGLPYIDGCSIVALGLSPHDF